MSAAMHRALVAPTWVLTGPPIIAAVLLGTAAHHLRTRKNQHR